MNFLWINIEYSEITHMIWKTAQICHLKILAFTIDHILIIPIIILFIGYKEEKIQRQI